MDSSCLGQVESTRDAVQRVSDDDFEVEKDARDTQPGGRC